LKQDFLKIFQALNLRFPSRFIAKRLSKLPKTAIFAPPNNPGIFSLTPLRLAQLRDQDSSLKLEFPLAHVASVASQQPSPARLVASQLFGESRRIADAWDTWLQHILDVGGKVYISALKRTISKGKDRLQASFFGGAILVFGGAGDK